MDLFLIRHGETDANVQQITQGWLDTDINKRGQEQAREAAKSFNEDIDAIFASDLKRAIQTAAVFREKFSSKPYYEDNRLRERNFGSATGHLLEKTDWDKFWSAPPNEHPLPDAESLDEYNARVEEFIEMLRKSGLSKVLIVTHSGTINRMRDIVNGEEHAHHANASVLRMTI